MKCAIGFFLLFCCAGCLEAPSALEGRADLGSTAPLPINHPAPTEPVVSKASADSLILGTRYYLRSVFEEIFQDTTTKPALQNILDRYLGAYDDKGSSGSASFEYITLLGAPCDIYSAAGAGDGCNGSRSNIFNPVYAPGTPSREAVRVKICTEITKNDDMINVALSRAGVSVSSGLNPVNFQSIFELFYPGINANEETQAAFKNLWDLMSVQNESNLDKWRMIYFSVCRTPEWQAL